jgi:hypothetical protein
LKYTKLPFYLFYVGVDFFSHPVSEHRNKPSGSMKGGEFFGKLSGCELPKKDSSLMWLFMTEALNRNFIDSLSSSFQIEKRNSLGIFCIAT